MGLVLASTSPYRKQLLDRLGLPFVQKAPKCNEEALKAIPYPGAAALARLLATEKVHSLISECGADTIIGGGRILKLSVF